MSADPAVLAEADARRVLMLRACETAPAGEVPEALWSAADAAWATRLATETAGADALPARWLAERARHAGERLRARRSVLVAAVQRAGWRPAWLVAAAAIGLAAGLAADTLAGGRFVNLLAPPWLAVLLWNLLVYAALGVAGLRALGGHTREGSRSWLRTGLAHLLRGRAAGDRPGRGAPGGVAASTLARFAADWAARSAPLQAARAALLLHVAAAALAAGLAAGLYLRGLVLDFRAGWQSTFLSADLVHALLHTLLAPASALTGIALPDAAGIAALQVGPGAVPAAPAAPWIHLFAATLSLAVVAPRLLLALGAAVRAGWRARRIGIELADPYFQRLLVQARRGNARVFVQPHGAAPSAQAVLGLRAVLTQAYGERVELQVAPALGYGDEDHAAPPPAGTTQRIALFDLAATPEPEAQGRFLAALRRHAAPLLVLADASAYRRRFATMPARLDERRAAWQRLAAEHGLALACIDLESADPAAGVAVFEAALRDAAALDAPAGRAPAAGPAS